MPTNIIWLLFCFISIGFTVAIGLISKRMLTNDDDHDPIAYASTLFLAVAVISFIFYILSGAHAQDFQNLFSLQVLPILLLNFVCYSVAPSLYYRALKNTPVSEVTIIYSLIGIFGLIIGVLIGTESFQLSRLVGGAVILFAIALLTLKQESWKNNKYVWMLVAATFIYSIAAVTDKYIVSSNYFNTLFFQSLSFGIPSVLLLVINPNTHKLARRIYTRRVYPTILLNAGFFFVSFYSIYNAYKFGGDVSQVNLVLSTEVIVMVIFAAIFLKERNNVALKLFAGALTIFGIFLLK